MGRTNIDDMRFFLAVEGSLGNPLSRFLINILSKKNKGSCLLDDALLSYTKTNRISILKKIKYAPLKALLGIGGTTFGADREVMQEFFSDPVVRKGLVNVMRSIGKYGVNRPFKLVAPFLVVWNYTNACNLRCKHCYQSASKPLPDELNLDEKRGIIDQFARTCMSKSRNVIAAAHFGTYECPDETRMLADFIGGCGAGRLYCAIQPNGIVTPCVYIPIEIGDLRKENFIDI